MSANTASHGWALSLEALTSRLSPTGLKWSSGGMALVLHLGLGAGALTMLQMQSESAPMLNRTLTVTLFTPVEVEAPIAPDEPELQTEVETPPVADQAPQERVEPILVEPVAEPPPKPSLPATDMPQSAPALPAGPPQVLTTEGGQAGWAPDAVPAVSARTAGALRGLLCAGGSEHTRAAAGCDSITQDEPNGFAAYASAEEVAKIESAFGPIESLGYSGGSTVNLGSFALPGQVNNNQPHYVSGVHSVFGQLPVSEKVRDPGFGD